MATKCKLTAAFTNKWTHTYITCVHTCAKFELATTKIVAYNSLQDNELKG